MKKLHYLLLALMLTQVNFAQEQEPETQSNKGKFNVHLGAGFATLEMEDALKYNANLFQSSILYTFPLTNNIGLETGISAHQLTGDFSMGGDNYFVSNSFLSVPVTLKIEAGSTFRYYTGLSLKPQYMVTSDFEVFGTADDAVRDAFEDNKGGSLLTGVVLGGQFGVSPSASVDIGLSLYGDLFQFGYNDNSKLKTNQLVAFHIGLSLF